MTGFGAATEAMPAVGFAANSTLNVGVAAGVAGFGPHAPVLNAAALTPGLDGAWGVLSLSGAALFTGPSCVPVASQCSCHVRAITSMSHKLRLRKSPLFCACALTVDTRKTASQPGQLLQLRVCERRMLPAAIASADGSLTTISLGIICSTRFAVLSSLTSAYRDGKAEHVRSRLISPTATRTLVGRTRTLGTV